jgi:hypothetical protein
VAKKYPYDPSADALLRPALNAAFFEDWNDDDKREPNLLCAEMSRLAYADPARVREALGRVGFELVGAFKDAAVGTQGFVATASARQAPRTTVLAFRGTEQKFEDLVTDFNTVQTVSPAGFPAGARIHSGFLKGYSAVRDQVARLLAAREGPLLITGHSLGAALATLAAVDHRPAGLVTFGSPRVGDSAFAGHFAGLAAEGAIRRYVDCCDVVARVPPERFDAVQFFTLFDELGQFDRLDGLQGSAARIAARLAAAGLDALFRQIDSGIEFTHVAPPRYVRGNGTTVDAPTADEQKQDQQNARIAYPHSATAKLDELTQLIKNFPMPASGTEALREFVKRLFALVDGKNVPLRDLADHAPINYLSGITGRGRPEPPLST